MTSKPALVPFACPRCGHRITGAHPNADVAHDCPNNLTTRGHPRWTRYQPQPEGDAAE